MIKLEFDEIKSLQAFHKREWLKGYAFISDLWVEGARNQFEQDKKLVEELQAQLEMAIEALKFECGDRCAEQNPCSAKYVIRQLEEMK